MSWENWLQLLALVASIFVVTRLLGPYLAKVLEGGPAPGDRVFLPVERLIYRVSGPASRFARRISVFSKRSPGSSRRPSSWASSKRR